MRRFFRGGAILALGLALTLFGVGVGCGNQEQGDQTAGGEIPAAEPGQQEIPDTNSGDQGADTSNAGQDGGSTDVPVKEQPDQPGTDAGQG